MQFLKYHALGNDYIVIDPAAIETDLTPDRIRAICHRHYGIGSDGILFGPTESETCDFGVRIFNPDGSEAEKSGNGLRIFARYLRDKGLAGMEAFAIETAGGPVSARVHETPDTVSVDMGTVSFDAAQIPVNGKTGEVLHQTMTVAGTELEYCAATVGNPHCIILRDAISEDETRTMGSIIETDPMFPNRTNVQFMKIMDRENVAIEIWERGAGYTLASGSSASASAAVARRIGKCDDRIAVHMPGGRLDITVNADYFISLTGPVTAIAEGIIYPEMFEA
ncbi:MAG: diaminopimelate epimerase [Thermodesulfobacteriota bacterium]|nr:diaminopimelate epimerase [Thermodesulfobacteriota bacterium]